MQIGKISFGVDDCLTSDGIRYLIQFDIQQHVSGLRCKGGGEIWEVNHSHSSGRNARQRQDTRNEDEQTWPIFVMSMSAVARPEVKPEGVADPASIDDAISETRADTRLNSRVRWGRSNNAR